MQWRKGRKKQIEEWKQNAQKKRKAIGNEGMKIESEWKNIRKIKVNEWKWNAMKKWKLNTKVGMKMKCNEGKEGIFQCGEWKWNSMRKKWKMQMEERELTAMSKRKENANKRVKMKFSEGKCKWNSMMAKNQHQKWNESEMRLRKERNILGNKMQWKKWGDANEGRKIKYAMKVKMEMGE